MAKLDRATFEAAFKELKKDAAVEGEGESDPIAQQMWAKIEPFLEAKGQFEDELRTHLSETTADLKSWRKVRIFSISFAVIIITLSVSFLIYILFCPFSLVNIRNLPSDAVRIALLAGPFATIFGLTAIIVRGAFTPASSDGIGLPMTENAKLFGELLSASRKAS